MHWLHLVVAQVVLADERRHVGVERAERLRAGPFVLQRAEEVDDLADRADMCFGGPASTLPGTPFRPSCSSVRSDQPAQ